MKALFVAGAHTDVGKTHVACAILEQARAAGLTVEAWKPVVSGFEAGRASDPARLAAACGLDLTPEAVASIAPLRYAAPLAPPWAARAEGVRLTLDMLGLPPATDADLLVVEGAGGLMSPVAEDATCLDLIAACGLPVVLVGGSYLGAISHTLTALALTPDPLAVVLSESPAPAPDFAATVADVRRFAGATPVIPLPRNGVVDFVTVLGLA